MSIDPLPEPATDQVADSAGDRPDPASSPATTEPGAPDHPVAELSAPLRQQIAVWAAQALGDLPPAQVPTGLHRVARFTPAKRARLGAAALIATVDSDPSFRAAVAGKAGADTAADPVRAAARAVMLRLPEADDLLVTAGRLVSAGESEAELADLRKEVIRLRRQVERLTTQREELVAHQQSRPQEQELDKLRRRLREQGTRVRAAEVAAEQALERAAALEQQLQTALGRSAADEKSWQDKLRVVTERADRAQQTVAGLREAGNRSRASADRRLELLLSTIEGAAAGLRREWDLIGGGADPADLVADRLRTDERGENTGDPARLGSWLQLPGAHLIVDGYNVTKTGFGELTLADQRERLVRGLGALGARTSAEITVVFDGAAVTVPQPAGRRVRVLFSPPGVIADDVIRELTRAEPRGRLLVIVSSDKEVVDRVAVQGARTATSAALLALLR